MAPSKDWDYQGKPGIRPTGEFAGFTTADTSHLTDVDLAHFDGSVMDPSCVCGSTRIVRDRERQPRCRRCGRAR